MSTPAEQHDEMARAAIEALDGYAAVAAGLATREVQGRSIDGRVTVQASGGGAIRSVAFTPGTLTRYDSERLGEIVTEAVRETQLRARRDFEEAMREAAPAAALEANRLTAETGPGA
jgi:DNA-binding protein YbaB